MARLSVNVDEEILRKLKKAAEQEGRTVSEIVRSLLAEFLRSRGMIKYHTAGALERDARAGFQGR